MMGVNLGLSNSLRGRLLAYLLGAILLAAVAQAVTAYFTALSQADVIFDKHMQKMAESLRSGRPLTNVPNTGFSSDRANEDFVVQVWTIKGEPIFESAAHRRLRQPAQPGFSDITALDGRIYRVYVLTTPTQIIQIAQDMAARSDMASSLALHTAGPILLIAPVLMLVVWWAIGRSLAPVAQVRSQMAARKADDLSPVSEAGLPDEVRPLIQELNLLFDRLRQAFEAQKSFVADAAHELRSPLAALKIQLQGLQRAADDAARGVAVRRLSSGIDRATHLVDQLLALARQEASAVSGVGRREDVDLSQIGLLALTDTLLDAQTRHIDLGVHRADAIVVKGQAEALRVLTRNLLDNAIKYTPQGGTVDMDVHHTPSGPVLSIEDSGPGIPEKDRVRVLDRFYRVSGAGADGSGLGLAIVKTIADQHGASVLIDKSERLGGLRVQVRFKA
jgi:two-component system OmpR family sensor kinase